MATGSQDLLCTYTSTTKNRNTSAGFSCKEHLPDDSAQFLPSRLFHTSGCWRWGAIRAARAASLAFLHTKSACPGHTLATRKNHKGLCPPSTPRPVGKLRGPRSFWGEVFLIGCSLTRRLWGLEKDRQQTQEPDPDQPAPSADCQLVPRGGLAPASLTPCWDRASTSGRRPRPWDPGTSTSYLPQARAAGLFGTMFHLAPAGGRRHPWSPGKRHPFWKGTHGAPSRILLRLSFSHSTASTLGLIYSKHSNSGLGLL